MGTEFLDHSSNQASFYWLLGIQETTKDLDAFRIWVNHIKNGISFNIEI